MAIIGLIASVLASAAVLGTGLAFTLRLLWKIKGSWDAIGAELRQLVRQVTDLVASKDADHRRIDQRADALESRLERHLEWHDKH